MGPARCYPENFSDFLEKELELHELGPDRLQFPGIVHSTLPTMDLQSPSILAQLPRPLHATTGKTHIGDVFGLADTKKRKRYEVAVAVDGEAVNIYNVGPFYQDIISLCNISNSYLLPDPNTQTRYVLRRSASVQVLLSSLLSAPEVEDNRETTDICRSN